VYRSKEVWKKYIRDLEMFNLEFLADTQNYPFTDFVCHPENIMIS